VGAGTVTFNVAWTPLKAPTVWSDTVWVFVDYLDVNANVMRRLELTGATLTVPSWSGASYEVPNKYGAWVMGNARDDKNHSFSTTVSLFTDKASLTGVCVYASNYPPVAEYVGDDMVSFMGTPPYDLVLKDSDGNPVNVSSGGTFYLPRNKELVSFSDKTGAPGIINCIPMKEEEYGRPSFAVSNAVTGQQATFQATLPTIPGGIQVTCSWSMPGFYEPQGTGNPFRANAPTATGPYEVTLTAHAAGYCDSQVIQSVAVLDCHGGRLKSKNKPAPDPNCTTTNDGGKIRAQR
jgi:hypothetical protein